MPETIPRFREIIAGFHAIIPDSADLDYDPDVENLLGSGVAEPIFRNDFVTYAEPNRYYRPRPIPFEVVSGELVTSVFMPGVDGGTSVVQPLKLTVTVDPRADQMWEWRLVFHRLTVGEYGDDVTPRPLRFQVDDGEGPVRLAEVATMGDVSVVSTSQGAYSLFRDGRPVVVATDGDGVYVVGSPA